MKHRTLGQHGFNVSEVGLGCWQLGADWGKDFDQQAAESILSTAVDAGVTFFDTADVYGDGRSETFIGNFLSSKDLDIRVATKRIFKPLSFVLFVIRQQYPTDWTKFLEVDTERHYCRSVRETLDQVHDDYWNEADQQELILK